MNLTLAMMKYPIKSVHGHTHSELEHLLEDSCNSFDDIVVLESTTLGGWMNVNLRGKSSEFDFVLKFPWTTEKLESNPYDLLYKLQAQFARLNISPHPIEVGRLKDSSETPFFLIEYITGSTHSKVADVSEDELLSLKESLRRLKREKPSGIPQYEAPSDFLVANHEPVLNHIWLSRASEETKNLLTQYNSLFPKIESRMDILGYWSGDVMHGDLWIPNILFRNSIEALILDFDMCSYGDSRYDFCRLMEGEDIEENIPALIPDEDLSFVNSLRPLAVAFIIDWSLERLLSMESGIVESILNTDEIRAGILRYAEEKINRLKILLP
ncbi:MAG: phosphotransferase [Candidatus Thorarchaeota archaeon]